MEHLLLIVIGILLFVILALCAKVWLLHRSSREITEAFRNILAEDTNILVDISSRDRAMRRLAADINAQLRLLRKERRRCRLGDRELKEAVTNISHDLRTPLTAISGYLDLLEREELSETAARYLAVIRDRTQALRELTEELFRYSVILADADGLHLEDVSLHSALEQSAAAFYAAFTARGITPSISMTEAPVVRRLDPAALSRVFSNILSNALKYSDGDLQIVLRDDGELCFTNTASGLDEVQVGRLFDRFFSVDAARNSTGLGLAISRTLVERMNGSIDAQYADGRLSVFVRFPEL